jgi:hypothetical protein
VTIEIERKTPVIIMRGLTSVKKKARHPPE